MNLLRCEGLGQHAERVKAARGKDVEEQGVGPRSSSVRSQVRFLLPDRVKTNLRCWLPPIQPTWKKHRKRSKMGFEETQNCRESPGRLNMGEDQPDAAGI